jgi:hypothetical protein
MDLVIDDVKSAAAKVPISERQVAAIVRSVILAGCGEPDLGELIKPGKPARQPQ